MLEFVLHENFSRSWNLFYNNQLDGMCSINKKAVGKCSTGKSAVGKCSTTVLDVRKCSTNSFFAVEQSIPCVEICSISILELESVLQFFSFIIRLSHFFFGKMAEQSFKILVSDGKHGCFNESMCLQVSILVKKTKRKL